MFMQPVMLIMRFDSISPELYSRATLTSSWDSSGAMHHTHAQWLSTHVLRGRSDTNSQKELEQVMISAPGYLPSASEGLVNRHATASCIAMNANPNDYRVLLVGSIPELPHVMRIL